MKHELAQYIFKKYSYIIFLVNLSSGSQVFPCGRTDMMNLKATLSTFANAPKKQKTTVTFIHIYICLTSIHNHPNIWGGADKSLAWPTSQCRMELIVLLKRGVCSCAELQVFSCYRGWKEACQVTHAISTSSRCKLLSSFFFPARQGTERNSRHSERKIRGTCTIVCHCQKLGGPV